MKFFSGASFDEAAALNASQKNLTLVIKQYLSDEANLEQLEPILNEESDDWLDKMNAIVNAVMGAAAGIPSGTSATAIYETVQRQLNSMNRKLAVAHGFQAHAALVKGKLVDRKLAIEHKPAEQQAVA